jgi:hypothetical protein
MTFYLYPYHSIFYGAAILPTTPNRRLGCFPETRANNYRAATPYTLVPVHFFLTSVFLPIALARDAGQEPTLFPPTDAAMGDAAPPRFSASSSTPAPAWTQPVPIRTSPRSSLSTAAVRCRSPRKLRLCWWMQRRPGASRGCRPRRSLG